jgi:hypothetical protein
MELRGVQGQRAAGAAGIGRRDWRWTEAEKGGGLELELDKGVLALRKRSDCTDWVSRIRMIRHHLVLNIVSCYLWSDLMENCLKMALVQMAEFFNHGVVD